MSILDKFRAHCAEMATAQHKPECHLWIPRPWGYASVTYRPHPDCPGCVSDKDRALFATLAAEIDDYRAPLVDLFTEGVCRAGVGGGEVCYRAAGHDGPHDPDSTEVYG